MRETEKRGSCYVTAMGRCQLWMS